MQKTPPTPHASLEKMVVANKRVSTQQLDELRVAMAKLSENGVRPDGYRLADPFAVPAPQHDEAERDRRTVSLRT